MEQSSTTDGYLKYMQIEILILVIKKEQRSLKWDIVKFN